VAWAWAIIGIAAVTILTVGLGALVLPTGTVFDRVVAGAVLTVAMVVASTAALAGAGVLSAISILAVLGAAVVAVGIAVRIRAPGWRPAALTAWHTAPVLLVGAAGLTLIGVADWYLPVWQWDAIGYHLPYVNLLLQHGTSADVPADVPYLSTYPHVVELTFTAWRALLPDDRLVELGHLPFGLLGVVAVGAIAHRHGARSVHAVVAGVAWLTLPAVLLGVATNYVDVASAALLLAAIVFVLGPMQPTRIVLAGIAIGLFLGSKPQAPPAAAVLLVTLMVLGWRARHRMATVGAAGAALAVGAGTYVINIIRFGNPVWPVAVDIGPLQLPGPTSMADLLASGANVPRAHGILPVRVWQSWTRLVPPLPAFDMRLGGFGVLFLIALPVAAAALVRTRRTAVWLCTAATLLTPDPSVARYVLAFAGITLAFAVTALSAAAAVPRAVITAAVAVAAAANLVIAYPGLTGEGPPLSAYPAMTPGQRQRAVGADGSPAPYLDVLAAMAPDSVTVVDSGAELPYLAWPADLSRAVLFLPDGIDGHTAEQRVLAPNVGLVMVGDDTPAGAVARRHPELLVAQFRCRSAPCTVYLRR